jgi:ATP-dependent DNA helicase RecG
VEPEEWLRKQQLLIGSKPTVAAVLLFAEEPQAILPKRCGVKIYRYRSKESEGTRDTLAFDPLTIEGCIYEQIRDTVAKTVEIVEGIQILGEHGLEDISYPVEAIHEIITNAVLHRDYSIPDDTHIRIFDNRIEVQSPGRLPGHITPKNILKERFARNAALVRLINKFPNPPNKDVGEGLNTAFEAMRQLRLKPPSIDELDEAVLVTVRHEPLASAEEIIIGYLDNNPEITNSVARAICHIGSENAMKRVLIGMVQRELLERVPDKRGKASAYRKQNPAE